eukprot:2987183-Pleurochrysis_carterae.AAC.1
MATDGMHSDIRCWRDIWDIPRDPMHRMYPIGSYALRGAGCHDNGDHVLYGLRAISGCRNWRPLFIWGSAPYLK